VLDGLLAAAMTAMVLVDLSSPADAVGVRPTDGWAVLLSLCQTVPLAFRRWAPLPAFLLIVLGVAVYYPLGYEVTDGTLATFVGVYTVAAYEYRRRSLVALGVLAVAMTWYWIARAEPYDPTTPVWIGILGLLSWGMGSMCGPGGRTPARSRPGPSGSTGPGNLRRARPCGRSARGWPVSCTT
jgi:hypothetical protein